MTSSLLMFEPMQKSYFVAFNLCNSISARQSCYSLPMRRTVRNNLPSDVFFSICLMPGFVPGIAFLCILSSWSEEVSLPFLLDAPFRLSFPPRGTVGIIFFLTSLCGARNVCSMWEVLEGRNPSKVSLVCRYGR